MHAVWLLQIRHPETSAQHKSKAMYSGLTHCYEFRISRGHRTDVMLLLPEPQEGTTRFMSESFIGKTELNSTLPHKI